MVLCFVFLEHAAIAAATADRSRSVLWFIGVLVVIALGAMIRWAGEERGRLSRSRHRRSPVTPSDADAGLERRLADLSEAAALAAREVAPNPGVAETDAPIGSGAGYPQLNEFEERYASLLNRTDGAAGDGMTYIFRARLSFATPLAMLELDGQRRGRHTIDATWSHGSWVPDIGTPSPGYTNPAQGPRDGEFGLGQFPADGGRLLPFLREYRRIVESSETAAVKIERCRALLPRPEFSEIAGRLPAHFPEAQFKRAINDIPGISDAMVDVLWARGCREPADVFNLTDEQLRSVPGIGPKRLEQIRVAQGAAMGAM